MRREKGWKTGRQVEDEMRSIPIFDPFYLPTISAVNSRRW